MRRTRSTVLAAVYLTTFALAAGCSSNKTTTTPPIASETPSETAAATPTLHIASFQYSPLTVKPGELVTVKNNDAVDHTATSKSTGLFDVSVTKGEPKTFTAPNTPGVYDIICRFHASMHGTLTVKA